MSEPVVLIAPPLVRACEPLLGLAVLKGYLEEVGGVPCACIDASVEAQAWLLDVERLDPLVARLLDAPNPSLRKRAEAWPSLRKRLERYKAQLRSWEGYTNLSRYRTAVTSLNRALTLAGAGYSVEDGAPIQISLSNYEDERYCDMASASVAEAAANPAHNLFFEYYRDVLIPRLVEAQPRVVGLSFIFRSQLLCGVVLAQMIREALPGTFVVFGGELISAWEGDLEENHLLDLADAILPYEGEIGLLKLARALESPEPDLAGVPNLIWREGGVVRRNATAKVGSLTDIPAPNFDWAPWDLYFAPVRTAPMVTARGCYWNRCTFCPEVVNPETLLRIAPSERLTADLDAIHERNGVLHFHFIDSAIPPRTLKDVARHIITEDRPYTWFGFSRLERTLGRPGTATLLAAGGCRMLKLGLETGSQRLLDVMDKRQDLGDVSAILNALREAGVMVHAFLMFGTPFEELEDAQMTLDFVKGHADAVNFINCSLMNLAHGSPMALDPVKHGINEVVPFEIEGHTLDLALYSNFNGEGWGRAEARRFLQRQFLKTPEIRRLQLQTPVHFDSNHSSFFHHVILEDEDEAASAQTARVSP